MVEVAAHSRVLPTAARAASAAAAVEARRAAILGSVELPAAALVPAPLHLRAIQAQPAVALVMRR